MARLSRILALLIVFSPIACLTAGPASQTTESSALKEIVASGHVTVLRENARALVTDATLFMPHAHTVCVDPETHLVDFPLQNIDGHPVLRIMAPGEPR